MKLSDVADTEGLGYREVLEREDLAHKARTAAREAATGRIKELERALAGQTAPDVAWAAGPILEIIERDPERFLDPKVLKQPDARALAKPVKQTPGMITNNRFIIRMHALAMSKLVNLIPAAERTALDDEVAGRAAVWSNALVDEEPK